MIRTENVAIWIVLVVADMAMSAFIFFFFKQKTAYEI